MANLGVNYRDAGRPVDGARLMEEALQRARGRPEVMTVLRGLAPELASAYENCGQLGRAEAVYREELATARSRSARTTHARSRQCADW